MKVSNIFKIIVLFVLIFVSYSTAIEGKYLWDDDEYVWTNKHLRTWEGLRQIWFKPGATAQYYPLSFTMFWVQYQLLGGHFHQAYHLFNILLHFVNSVLAWFLLKRLGLKSAYIVAFIFAVHPVHVESVAWISEIKNVLSTLFYLLSVFSYLRFMQEKRNRFYVLSIFCFILGMLSKTVVCTLPFVILLLIWWKNKRILIADVLRQIPYFVIGVFLGLLTIWCERLYIADTGQHLSLSWLERGLVAGRAFWFYPAKLLWPVNLSFIYSQWDVDPRIWWQYLFPLAVVLTLGVMIIRVVRTQKGRGLLAGTLFYLITISIALGFVDVETMRYTFVADHYQYLASLGIIALFCEGVYGWIERRKSARMKFTVIALLAVLITVLSFLTHQQGRIYADRETLYTDVINNNPRCWLAYNNRGSIYLERHQYDLALADFNRKNSSELAPG